MQKYELILDGSDIELVLSSAAPFQQTSTVPNTANGDFLNGITSLDKQFSRLVNKIWGCSVSELRLWIRKWSFYILMVSKEFYGFRIFLFKLKNNIYLSRVCAKTHT